MKFIIHADDFGLSRGITDSILDCWALNSMSIYAFDYVMQEYKKRPGLRIHLNLVDGTPLLFAYKLSTLVDKKAIFITPSNRFG